MSPTAKWLGEPSAGVSASSWLGSDGSQDVAPEVAAEPRPVAAEPRPVSAGQVAVPVVEAAVQQEVPQEVPAAPPVAPELPVTPEAPTEPPEPLCAPVRRRVRILSQATFEDPEAHEPSEDDPQEAPEALSLALVTETVTQPEIPAAVHPHIPQDSEKEDDEVEPTPGPCSSCLWLSL